MQQLERKIFIMLGLALLSVACGCQNSGKRDTSYSIAGSGNHAKRTTRRVARKHKNNSDVRIRHVRCLYDQKPWISTDKAGDRDPEGIHYRVFLEPASTNSIGKSILGDGEFYIEMYHILRKGGGKVTRELVSDWRYSTSTFQVVKSNILGMGYHVWLRWAQKDLAGKEIEIITWYEDTSGRKVRSGTKRFRVPSYVS